MVQVPTVSNVSAPPGVMLQMPGVEDAKLTVNPELAVAVSVGVVPKFCEPGLANENVCAARGVALFEAVDAGPVPALLDAVTVNVYAMPFVRPVTVSGEEGPVDVTPPGLEVTV